MPTASPEDTGPRRRVILRRARGGGGGFSPSISTRSESLRATEAEMDEVDDAIAPETLSREIRTGAVPAPSSPDAERDNPRMRLNQVALAGSSAYAKEYRLQLLHRLLMRNIPLDQIARQLQVSISTVEKDRALLKSRLREAATEMNINEMVGGQNAVYDEIAGMALRIASTGNSKDENGNSIQAVPTAMRLAAMRTALAANADRTRFLNTAGVFDVLRFRRAEDGSALSDVQQLMMQTAELLESLNADEPAAAPKKGGKFAPMTFDDAGASSSDNEVVDL